jgi:osmotically-inducible protein OsmY
MTKQEELIKKRVIDQLFWDERVDASDIQVKVNGREVILEGTVPDHSTRQAAVMDTWQSNGVGKVTNKLKIRFTPEYKIPTDKEVKKIINNLLAWNRYIDEKNITVKVFQGDIELKGSVDAYWKKLSAEQIASTVPGIKEIRNELTVVPTDDYFDKKIAESITSALDRSYTIKPDEINIRVTNGIVTLSGKVANWSAYRAAMFAVENTAGVTDITDEIKIDALEI